MPDAIEEFFPNRKPTAERPLLGQTVLLVEDSRFASEAMRLLCLRSGARIRRADSLRSANRHLRTYRPTIAIVDLGLPDGSGLDLIAQLAAAQPRVDVLLAVSGDDGLARKASLAGADGFLAKPVTSIAAFQEAILSRLPAGQQPRGPRALSEDRVYPDRMALKDDLEHALDLLDSSKGNHHLPYLAQFLGGLARLSGDDDLAFVVEEHLCGAKPDIAPVRAILEDRLLEKAVV